MARVFGHDHGASRDIACRPSPSVAFSVRHLLPILIAFAAVLCVLIVLPMSWLVYFSVTDRDGASTFANFAELITNRRSSTR